MKAAVDREAKRVKKERLVMTLDHVRLLIGRYYKRPAKKVRPADRRFMLQQLLMFFGMRRFDDVKEIGIEDVTMIEEGDLEILLHRARAPGHMGVGNMGTGHMGTGHMGTWKYG